MWRRIFQKWLGRLWAECFGSLSPGMDFVMHYVWNFSLSIRRSWRMLYMWCVFEGWHGRKLMATHRHMLTIAAAPSHALVLPYFLWFSRALLLRCKQTWVGWTFPRSFLLVVQRYKTASESTIYCRRRVVAKPVSHQCAHQENATQPRRHEEMRSTQRMNRLFEPPPTCPPTEVVSMWRILPGLVKFEFCVFYCFRMDTGFPLFGY